MRKPHVLLLATIATICMAMAFAVHGHLALYESEAICFSPGLRDCTTLSFAPPKGHEGVRVAPDADVLALGDAPVRIRVGILAIDGYVSLLEAHTMLGPDRVAATRKDGALAVRWETGPETPVLEVDLESSQRTYWTKMRRRE